MRGKEDGSSNAHGYLAFGGSTTAGGSYKSYVHKIFVGGDTAWDSW